MAVPKMRGSLTLALVALMLSAMALFARADEIRLKDGKKLYGVIVSYEDNMFKVKTDYGYVLVEKDKIASIVPSTPAGKPEAATAKKDAPEKPATPTTESQPQAEPAKAPSTDASTTPTNANAKPVEANPATKTGKPAPKITNTAVKPEVPTNTTAANVSAPAIKGAPATTSSGLPATAA